MKIPRWFNRSTPLQSYLRVLRVTTAGLLVAAAAALGYTSLKVSSPPSLRQTDVESSRPVKLRKGFEFGNRVVSPGPEGDRGPLAYAEEQYDIRAYPAEEIPLSVTLNAQAAFNNVKKQGVGQGKNVTGQWTLIGPSNADFPAVLTFSGAHTTTSGRVTGLAIDPACSTGHGCRAWVAAAGGGIWRTDNALSGSGAGWKFVSGSFLTNAIGTIVFDSASNTLYAGTGEPNASGDSEAGMGLYKSTDGGDTWTLLPALTTTTISGPWINQNAFLNRAISAVVVHPTNPLILYVGSGSAVRGVASVSGAAVNPPTPLPGRGVYRSTDGGQTFTLLNSATSGLPFVLRGVTDVKLDPTNPNTIYAGQFGQGVFRSTDAGATWTQIFAPVNPSNPFVVERDSIAVTTLPNGHTRMYLGAGDDGSGPVVFAARIYRSDQVESGAPVFTNMTTTASAGYCRTQCWYDNVVYTPAGLYDTVFLGGAYDYENYGHRSNGRAFIQSTNGGTTWADQTWDATTAPNSPPNCCNPNPIAPNGMHPDSHAIVRVPGTNSYIFGSDGGVVRTSGAFADISSQCASRGLSPSDLAVCQELLSRAPTKINNLNQGLSTLQFQSLSVAADNPKHLQGGTQDNGTFETYGSSVTWPQIIYGDGGQSGFNVANSALRLNTFTGQFNDVNFQNGDPTKWVIATGVIASSPEGAFFYPPIIADPHPTNAGSIYQGSFSVWRTQDWGGSQAYLEANCPEFTTSAFNPACGDFVRIGNGVCSTDLGDGCWGTRAGSAVGVIERTKSDTGTIWAGTGTGRIFYSANGNAAAASVVWERLDLSSTVDPNRFPSSIYIDPANSNHAWISYSGYNVNTPSQPGHVFEVTRSGPSTATWTNISYNLGDQPITDLVRDDVTGDLYASSDFGVMRLRSGTTTWVLAGNGLPMVEVPGLTIVPSARVLYAATHGRSAWSLKLP
jgi:hypothetical protein